MCLSTPPKMFGPHLKARDQDLEGVSAAEDQGGSSSGDLKDGQKEVQWEAQKAQT